MEEVSEKRLNSCPSLPNTSLKTARDTGKQTGRRRSGKQVVPETPRLRTAARPVAESHTPRVKPQRGEAREEPRSPTESGRGSLCSSLVDAHSTTGDEEAESDASSDNVKVLVRMRPPTAAEAQEGICVSKASSKCVVLRQPSHEPQSWTFDYVAGETASQEEMFQVGGQPIVENCMAGYNSSIFAYGQTGAGKTYTMQGSLADHSQRGLAARVFEWLFKRIAEEEYAAGRDSLRYTCKCSFLEIYNEAITDLLRPGATNLQLREDVSRGCFVDGLSEEVILNVEDATALIRRGAQNRRIGQTRMNHESSRSHSVFTCTIESTNQSAAGLTSIRFSRLNLVDLAGSERNKASGARGEHLKEACLINQSLTALGRVIMELADAQRNKRSSHIPYRDSRLTFLLQDSLGGNAKSMIIANISPALSSCHETLSTLQFVSRAKHIRNKAVVNQDTQAASLEILKRELHRLHRELEVVRSSASEPLVAEVARLTREAAEARKQAADAADALALAASEAKLAKTGALWAEARVAMLEGEKAEVQDAMAGLLSEAGGGAPATPDTSLLELLALVADQAAASAQARRSAEEARNQAQSQYTACRECMQALQASVEERRAQQLARDEAEAELMDGRMRALESDKQELQAAAGELTRLLREREKEAAGLRARMSGQEEAAGTLGSQVACIREELARRDQVAHAECVAREARLREVAGERNALQAALAAAQADVLALTHAKAQEAGETEKRVAHTLQALEQQVAESKEACARSVERLAQAEADAARLVQENASLCGEVERARQDLKAAREEAGSAADNARRECAEHRNAEESLREQLSLAGKELHVERQAREDAERRAETAAAGQASAVREADSQRAQIAASKHAADVARQEVFAVSKRAEDARCEFAAREKGMAAQLREQRQASAMQQSLADQAQRRQASEMLRLQTELQSMQASLGDARQAEADAAIRAARFKHMLGDIDNIIKWARSPGGTPTASRVPSFRAGGGGMPSPQGSQNPLFVAHQGVSSLSLSQEWGRLALQASTPTFQAAPHSQAGDGDVASPQTQERCQSGSLPASGRPPCSTGPRLPAAGRRPSATGRRPTLATDSTAESPAVDGSAAAGLADHSHLKQCNQGSEGGDVGEESRKASVIVRPGLRVEV